MHQPAFLWLCLSSLRIVLHRPRTHLGCAPKPNDRKSVLRSSSQWDSLPTVIDVVSYASESMIACCWVARQSLLHSCKAHRSQPQNARVRHRSGHRHESRRRAASEGRPRFLSRTDGSQIFMFVANSRHNRATGRFPDGCGPGQYRISAERDGYIRQMRAADNDRKRHRYVCLRRPASRAQFQCCPPVSSGGQYRISLVSRMHGRSGVGRFNTQMETSLSWANAQTNDIGEYRLFGYWRIFNQCNRAGPWRDRNCRPECAADRS